ncbi:MAG: hypothetical protein BWZ10_03425 [candidate division BRC1 bacterium ADurb.BinA364]|nr:MAG: hypothetical protein BWZ10_03425 [candidate division BRC1 bacterium ADurb.BinA364]
MRLRLRVSQFVQPFLVRRLRNKAVEGLGNRAEVGFADHDVPIALGLEQIGQERKIAAALHAVFDAAVDRRVRAREQRAARGHANRRGRVGLGEEHAFGGQFVGGGRTGEGAAHAAQGVPALGVGDDQQQIRLGGHENFLESEKSGLLDCSKPLRYCQEREWKGTKGSRNPNRLPGPLKSSRLISFLVPLPSRSS